MKVYVMAEHEKRVSEYYVNVPGTKEEYLLEIYALNGMFVVKFWDGRCWQTPAETHETEAEALDAFVSERPGSVTHELV